MSEKIVVHNSQSPGDYIVMSASIRDIQRAYPGRYEIMVKVPQPAIYDNNPYTSKFNDHGIRRIKGMYNVGPYSIHKSNANKAHFLWGFLGGFNEVMGTKAVLTEFKPDLHLTPQEMLEPPGGIQKPYWVFASGGKRDFTAKWWDPNWWQQVATKLSDKFTMVQVGGSSHVHPHLNNVIDLVGKTSFRDLMRLIYHSEGVICIVTCLMHIAAAFNKPCVVVAGGREPWWWEGYTKENRLYNMRLGIPDWEPPCNDNFIEHKYLHTLGQLSCCQTMGCWKSRIEGSNSVCQKVVKQNGISLPRCMQMITPEMVVDAVDSYYSDGIIIPTDKPKAPIHECIVRLNNIVPPMEMERPNFIGLVHMPKAKCDLAYVNKQLTEMYIVNKGIISHTDNEEIKPYTNSTKTQLWSYDDNFSICLKNIANTMDGLIVLVEPLYRLRSGWENKIPDEVRAGQSCAGVVYRDKDDRTKFYLKDGLLVCHTSILRSSVLIERSNGLEFIDRSIRLTDVSELICKP